MSEVLQFTGRYGIDRDMFSALLRVEDSFDVVRREFIIGGKQAALYFIDGFIRAEIVEKMLEYLTAITPQQMGEAEKQGVIDPERFCGRFITYVEAQTESDASLAVTQILSGVSALQIDGCDRIILIKARNYPTRGLDEPENERALRGSHDGFCETLIVNTALIRRRIRDPKLTMEHISIAGCHTDVVLCYMQGAADEKHLQKMRKKLKAVRTEALHMGQASLIETILGEQWFNPFPRVRFTERPDSAAASIQEGQIVLLTDTSPQAIILPCSIFTFTQDINDFYFPPLVGTYLRWVRFAVGVVTLLLTPVWYLMISNPDYVPSYLQFAIVDNQGVIPVLMQFIVIELLLDGLKLASLNTPSALSNSLSVVGALLLGDLAIQAGWFSPEVVLYMAFVAVSTYTLTSFEISYALKFNRMLLLILTAICNLWGFVLGILLLILQLFTVKTLDGCRYLSPLIPFDWKKLSTLLVRRTKKG